MTSFQRYAAEHPAAIGLLFAGITGYCAYNAFRAGRLTAILRGDTARLASESLGG